MIHSIQEFKKKAFNRFKNLSPLRFIIELSLIHILLVFVLELIKLSFSNESLGDTLLINSLLQLNLFDRHEFILLLLIIPIFETFLMQFLPIQLVSIINNNQIEQWILASFFYASMQSISSGTLLFIYSLFSGGIYSFSFLLKRSKSLWSALWITFILNATWNLLSFGIVIIIDGLKPYV